MLKLLCDHPSLMTTIQKGGAEIKCYIEIAQDGKCPKKRNIGIMDWECIVEAGFI